MELPNPQTPDFKALIIGGSIAGLTLAHCFSQAAIANELLEARNTMTPELGASIVIMPNGMRILDQLGLYEGLVGSGIMASMKRSFTWRSDGRLVGVNEWQVLVEEKLGYSCGICERVEFLRYMYNALKDPSKVHLSKKVVAIQHKTDSVTVECEDGSVFEGDVVIGADGIHSRTRREMQKLAFESGKALGGDENCITAQYTCIYGISAPIPHLGLHAGDSHTSTDIDASTLLFVGPNDIPQFASFFKLPQKLTFSTSTSSTSSRPTKAEMLSKLNEYSNVNVTKNVKLGDLVKTAKRIDGFPLEEGTFNTWTHGRIVCVGDSIHKMTPNLGQGGNQAIESCAVLTNSLVSILQTHNQTYNQKTGKATKVGQQDLETALKTYQDQRIKRAQKFVKLSGVVTRNDTLETLRHVLRFLYFPQVSGEVTADIQTELFHTAPYLDFLPLPERTKDNEYWKEGVKKLVERSDALVSK